MRILLLFYVVLYATIYMFGSLLTFPLIIFD